MQFSLIPYENFICYGHSWLLLLLLLLPLLLTAKVEAVVIVVRWSNSFYKKPILSVENSCAKSFSLILSDEFSNSVFLTFKYIALLKLKQFSSIPLYFYSTTPSFWNKRKKIIFIISFFALLLFVSRIFRQID